MHVPADTVRLAPHDEGGLAVRLQAHDTVDHVDSRPLEGARPRDVVLFIHPRFEFHERGHFLPVLGGARQGRDDRARPAGAVQGLLDGEDLRIVGGPLDEFRHASERLIG